MCSSLNITLFQIAREHGIRFLETSAKANINIEQAFLELAEAILNKTPGRDPQVIFLLIQQQNYAFSFS